jgi:hypothetical protein
MTRRTQRLVMFGLAAVTAALWAGVWLLWPHEPAITRMEGLGVTVIPDVPEPLPETIRRWLRL